MNKNGNKNKQCLGLRDNKISNNKLSGILNKEINLEKIRKSKYYSPKKKFITNKKRTIKINSYSSSHDNKNEPNLLGLKNKNDKKCNFKNDLKINNIFNNSLAKNNKCANSISKDKINRLNISKSKINKKGINIHYSFFMNDFTNKYNRNLYLFNRTSDSLNKPNSLTKNNSTSKKLNSLNKANINNIKISKNLNSKNSNNQVNNIRRINITNKIKPKDIKEYYSIKTLTTPYNIYN